MFGVIVAGLVAVLPLILLPRVIAAANGTATQTIRVQASWIKPQNQIRTDYGTQEEQRRFGESVKVKQLQPLVSLKDGTLVCGYRRYHCGMLVGMTEFLVIILDEELSETQIKVYRLTENLQRKDLSAWEMFQSCEELMRMNPNWQMRDLAAHLHFDPASITRYLSPARCITAWRDALKDGLVGVSDCYAASKLPESEQAGLLEFKLSGATRDQLEERRKKSQTAAPVGDTHKINRAKCAIGTTGVVVTVSGPSMNLEQYLNYLTQAREMAMKAIKENIDLKTAQRVWADKARASS